MDNLDLRGWSQKFSWLIQREMEILTKEIKAVAERRPGVMEK